MNANDECLMLNVSLRMWLMHLKLYHTESGSKNWKAWENSRKCCQNSLSKGTFK